MPDITSPSSGIAASVLVWCGVTSPTPAEVEVAELAATYATDTISRYRGVTPFETEYTSLAIEMAVYLYSKRGADGATSYGENGVQRSFEKGSIPPSMLSHIPLGVTTG